MLSIPFYDFPSSPLLIIGALGILVAIAVFFLAYQKYFNSPFNKELQQKKKSLLNEKQELNKRLQKIDLIENIFVQELNTDYNNLKIKYLGNINKIIEQLKSENIILELKGDQWIIELI